MIIKLQFENQEEHIEYCIRVVKNTGARLIPYLEYKRLEDAHNELSNLHGQTKQKLMHWEKFYARNKKALDAMKDSIKTDTRIEKLNLSNKIINPLMYAGINTVEELYTKSDNDLLMIENIGRKSIIEIKQALLEFKTGK
jgi:DNA-directed RNA polymerase alpha subunit